jgi:hypothetical protein
MYDTHVCTSIMNFLPDHGLYVSTLVTVPYPCTQLTYSEVPETRFYLIEICAVLVVVLRRPVHGRRQDPLLAVGGSVRQDIVNIPGIIFSFSAERQASGAYSENA